MVYVVYSSSDKFYGVYEDESEANGIAQMKSDNEIWKVVDLPYFKKEAPQKLHYSEEDSVCDESYYIDKINMLKYQIKSEKKKFKILEEFTNFFIMLLIISTLYSCGLLYLLC